jgi:cytochrome P450
LSRRTDVAPAFKDFDTYASSCGVTFEEIQVGEHEHDQSIFWMDPPAHRRITSLVNKVFDDRAFTDADTFGVDIDRTKAQSLAFGYGIHSCVGAALARVNALSRWNTCWTSCRSLRSTETVCAGWR